MKILGLNLAQLYTLSTLLISFLLFSGCGISRYTAETKLSGKVTDSTGVTYEWNYVSDKDQELLVDLVKTGDKIVGLKVAVKSSTSDAALTAMAKMQGALADLLEKLMPLIAKGAMAGS